MNSQNLEINTPLKPGVWVVAVVYEGKKIAANEFLIVPQIGDEHLQFDAKDDASQKTWGKYLPIDTKSGTKRRENALLMKHDISSYLDRTTTDFYSIQDICYVGNAPKCAEIQLHDWQSCSSTDWSSFSQDPKSKLL